MNNTLKKGLVSVAAASMLSTVAFAGSTITTTAATTYYDTYPGVNMGIKSLSILESGVSGFGTTGKLTIKIPANAHLNEINGSGVINLGGGNSNTLRKNATYLGTSTSPKNIVVDVNTTADGEYGLYVFHSDDNRSKIAEVYVDADAGTTKVYKVFAGTSVSNAVEFVRYDTLYDLNTSSVGTVDGVNDANKTVGKIYYDSTTDETVLSFAVRTSATALEFFNLNDLNISADTNESGSVSLTVSDGDAAGGTTASVTAGTIQIGNLVSQPMKLDYTGTVPNVSAGSSSVQGIVDFNLTAVGAMSDDTSTVILTISGATPSANSNSAGLSTALADGNITNTGTKLDGATGSGDATDGNLSVTTTTIVLDVNHTVASGQQISFKGNPLLLNTASVATGTTITAAITGTGDLSYLSIPAFTIANAVTDGVTLTEADNNDSKYSIKAVVPGRTLQNLVDINVSELFAASFSTTSGANQLTFTLPSGYTYTSAPVATMYTDSNSTTEANPVTLNAAIGANIATVQFGSTAGDIELRSSSTAVQHVQLSGIKVTVPTTATDAEIVSIAVAGNMITATKTLNASSINAGVVATTVASVTELNTTVGTVGTGTSIGNGYVAFDVNESFAGQLTAGNTITVSLSAGTFAPATVQNSTDVNIDLSSPIGSDSNTTVTYTVSSASTGSATSGSRIHLPTVSLSSVTTPTTVTATIAGTAGVTGTINIVSTELGNTTKANSIVAVTKGDVDSTIGEIEIAEGIASGFSTTAGANGYKLIAPVGVSFTGSYFESSKILTSATDTTTVFSTYSTNALTNGIVSTTFNTNDTLTLSLPTTGSYIDTVRIKPVVNINTTSADGTQAIQIKDINSSGVIATTGLNIAYVGTIPTMTVTGDATVATGGTTSVTVTDATGTVTYASSDATVATVDSAGLVTVDANATAATTAIITATDGLTAQAGSVTITVGAAVVVPDTLSGDITIGTGWNLVSSPVDGTVNSSVLNAVAQKSGTTAVVWPANSTGTNYGSMGEAIDMAPGQGAWVLADTAGTASFTGVTPATTAFSLATHVASLTAGGFGGGGYYLVGTPVATTFADVITAGAKIVWTFDTANNTYVGVNPAFAGQTGFDADGYYGGATSATAISAGSGFWYSAQ